jgi:PAS domain S-box-containing protein
MLAPIEPGGLFLASILEALPNPVFVKDEAHRWVVLNDSYCRFMGHERAELLGKSDFDFFPKEEAEVFWAKDDAVFASGEINENEERFTDAAGREHVILTRKTLHVDAAGRRFLLGVITDVTHFKELEGELRRSRLELEERVRQRTAELERANARLRDQDRQKNEFIGMLSHELRNPLAPIWNSIFILNHAPPDGEQARRAKDVLQRQAGQLGRLVDDLLDVTRVARGKIELRRERVDLGEIVRRTGEDHRALLEGRGIALAVEVPTAPVWVDGDATRLAQIVGNLLHNAAKFTGRGGGVLLEVAGGPDGAMVRVRDTGCGIEPGLLEHVFEPFTQGPQGPARNAGGLGLGLALVKGLAVLHGGSVEARSEGAGRGTEVVVRLPAASVPAPARPAATSPHAPGGRRVLVVDDDRDAAESLAQVVQLLGHRVEVAFDGPSALARASTDPPDVVLCDLGLPGVSGYELSRALRACRHGPMRLIAVSGYAQPEDVQAAKEAGFDAHVAKPADLEQLERLLA